MKTSIAALVACWIASVGAARADTITLRVADSFPNGHFIVDKVTKPWIAAIEARTHNAVKIEYYPAEQLGKAKDILQLTGAGVVDIGYVAPAFVGDKMPLSVVAELPLDFTSSCQATPAYYKLAAGDGLLAKAEFKPNNVHLLWTMVLPPYQIMLGKGHKLDGLKSLEGLKIRTTGGAKELALRELGAVPVQIPSPEVYQALTRGTIDGALWPYTSVYSYHTEDAYHSASIGENFGSFVVTYVINESKWKSLPPDVQKAITETSEDTLKVGCKVADAEDAEVAGKLKTAGWDIVKFSDADHAALVEKMRKIDTDWAAALDKRGKAGSATLEAFQAALKEQEK
jgi:TRAP-type C4-dicarboxylate transport system substrate-binding protein